MITVTVAGLVALVFMAALNIGRGDFPISVGEVLSILLGGGDLLLLDEPTTFLDLAHQIDVLGLVERLHTDTGRTVIMVLHDINMAARYAQRLIAMRAGRIIAQGTPSQVLTQPLLRKIFELEAQILTDPVTTTPLIVPISRRNHQPTPKPPPPLAPPDSRIGRASASITAMC
jgi:ABC-type oligopeptide transport system ATPase subunit